MTIRYATQADQIHIIRSIQNKHMDFNTVEDVKNDIACGNLIVAEDQGKLLGSIVVKYKPHRNYYAIMRGCVYNKKNYGKRIISTLIDYVLALNLGTYGATPWNDNPAIIKVFQKRGFQYQYTFNEKYDFYKKNV